MRRILGLLLGSALTSQVIAQSAPSPLFAIDQHRTTVVERIVNDWGDKLVVSGAQINREQLREMLFAMRADQLLAASLAGSIDGLRDVLANALATPENAKPRSIATKVLGDSGDDVVYTPVTPCRLVETRGTFAAVYQGGGAFATNEVRNYTVQGGNGVCLSQLPAGLHPGAIQLQVFGIPINSGSNGDVEILPQGSSFGSTATLVYLGNNLFTSASTTARINLANNQIGVQVRGGGANVAIDVVGYFKSPGGYFAQGGNAFGVTALLGTIDNQPLNINVNGERVMRFEPNATSPNVIGGHVNNGVYGGVSGAAIAGGGAVGAQNDKVLGALCELGYGCLNGVTDAWGTIGGGAGNQAGDGVGTTSDTPFATVAGGVSNWAFGEGSSVGGGIGNRAGGLGGTVSGGADNTASGFGATVGGGYLNTASGNFATVAGGYRNTASGESSFAAGTLATIPVGAYGSFLWSDSTGPVSLPANSHDVFIAVATNGIGFYTFKDYSHGCYILGAAASWTCTSDRAAKADITAIEPRDVLARLVAMPIAQWRFKGEPDMVRHIGPMAQDFRASFGLGHDDKGITGVDADGVALAAIQGLDQVVQEKDARIAALEQRLRQLERIVEALTLKQ